MNTPRDPLRFDPLLIVHKAVRQVMFEVVTQLGALDASDIFAVDRCATQVGRLVQLLPEAAARLRPQVDALYQRDGTARRAAADALYREVTALVASQLGRQQHAEATATVDLQARHTDDELRAMRREQLGAMDEGELAEAVGPLGEALTPQELAAFLDDLQVSVDTQTFSHLADVLQRRLDPARWARVVRERGDAEAGEAVASRRTGARRPGKLGSALSQHRRSHRADRQRLLAQ